MIIRMSALALALAATGCASQRYQDPEREAQHVKNQIEGLTARERETAANAQGAQATLNQVAAAQTANSTSLAEAMQLVRDLQAKGVSLESQRRLTEDYLASLASQSSYDRARLEQLQRDLAAINAVIHEQQQRELDGVRRR